MIPKTLAEVAELVAHGESFDLCLGNFLDSFLSEPTAQALAPEPVRLADKVPQLGNVEDAYLAATAEWLARKFNLKPPRWAFDASRRLHAHGLRPNCLRYERCCYSKVQRRFVHEISSSRRMH